MIRVRFLVWWKIRSKSRQFLNYYFLDSYRWHRLYISWSTREAATCQSIWIWLKYVWIRSSCMSCRGRRFGEMERRARYDLETWSSPSMIEKVDARKWKPYLLTTLIFSLLSFAAFLQDSEITCWICGRIAVLIMPTTNWFSSIHLCNCICNLVYSFV
jgi:hypothetical protein